MLGSKTSSKHNDGVLIDSRKHSCQFIAQALMWPLYGEKCKKPVTVKEDTRTNIIEGIMDLQYRLREQVPNKALVDLVDILMAFCRLHDSDQQSFYDDVVKQLVCTLDLQLQRHMLVLVIHLVCLDTKHDDKRLSILLALDWDPQTHLRVMKEIMANIIVMSKVRQETSIFRIQRTVFFEMLAYQRILANKKIRSASLVKIIQWIVKLLHVSPALNQHPQHRVLTIRKFSKLTSHESIAEAVAIAKQAVSFSTSPLVYYYIGKLQPSIDHNCPLCQCEQSLKQQQPTDIFTRFVYSYFLIKIELAHIEHSNPQITPEFVDDVMKLYDNNLRDFSYVKTLQFLKYRNNLPLLQKKILQRIASLEESRKMKQLFDKQLLQDRRQRFLQKEKKQPIMESPTRSLTQSQYGPKMRIQRTIDSQRKLEQWIIPHSDMDISQFESHFIRKANRDGEVYALVVSDSVYTMKQYPFVFWSTIEKFVEQVKAYTTLDHPNLRKILANCPHDRRSNVYLRDTGTISIIYHRYDCNLQEYLQTNTLDLHAKLGIMVKVIDCVLYLHTNGVVCTNIKPANILLLTAEPYVTDWDMHEFEQQEADGHGFLAPELFHKFHMLDECTFVPANDVWSLGVLMLYILFNSFLNVPLEPSQNNENDSLATSPLKLSQMSSHLNVYRIPQLKLDFSELQHHYVEGDIKRLDQLKMIIEGMVVRDLKARTPLLDVALRMYEIIESW